jgi:hypothetical protein
MICSPTSAVPRSAEHDAVRGSVRHAVAALEHRDDVGVLRHAAGSDHVEPFVERLP